MRMRKWYVSALLTKSVHSFGDDLNNTIVLYTLLLRSAATARFQNWQTYAKPE